MGMTDFIKNNPTIIFMSSQHIFLSEWHGSKHNDGKQKVLFFIQLKLHLKKNYGF